MVNKISLLAVSVFICAQANSQTVSGKVTGSDNQPSASATVSLYRAKDSVLSKTALTDIAGKFEIANIREGMYFLAVSAVGNSVFRSAHFSIGQEKKDQTFDNIVLIGKDGPMQEVTVVAKKPFIQKLSDRIVVNVDGSIIGAGSSAFDVLERSPGIQIDPNDNISMRGRAGVIIMIDGKPSPMTGADLVNFLRGLPANAIDRIDLITNPSAKYDASGNAGIIDIRMKKDQRLGSNGTFTTGYGQGVYPKANAGISWNYRNKKVNLFGNYNYAYRMNLNHLLLDRNFFNNGTFSGKDEKDNYTKIPVKFNTLRFGADFFPSARTVFGFVVNGNLNYSKPANNNSSVVFDSNRQPTFHFKTSTANDNRNKNFVININLKHTIDSTGKEISVDADYGRYNTNGQSFNATKFYDLSGAPLRPDYVLQGRQAGHLDFITSKADYVHPVKKGVKWEVGLKTSYVSSDNDARFHDWSSGTPQPDLTKTNRFFYKETNNAGYINFHREFKKFSLLAGLRGEHTGVNTRQVMGDIRWDSSYFQLFPSVFLNYKIREDQTLGFSVSRRIDRPGYSQLNPFLFLIDVTTYSTGNPGLLPQFTWAFDLSYTASSLSLTFGYSRTRRNQAVILSRFKDVFPLIPSEDNVTVQIPVNLTSSDYYGLTIAAPMKVNKWWNMINNASIYYNHFNGNLSGTSLDNGRAVLTASTNNTFTFNKGWTAELSGSFNSGGQSGYMTFEPQWAIGAGLQKKILKDKGTLRVNITDICWTNLPEAVMKLNNYIEYWHAYRETRVANIAFTYRFGNNKVAQARRRTTASEEERQRAGN